MRVKITLAPGARAVLTATDATGKKTVVDTGQLGQITLDIEPFFIHSRGAAEILLGEVSAAKRGPVDKFTLQVSGLTGKLTRKPEQPIAAAKRVVPVIDTRLADVVPVLVVTPTPVVAPTTDVPADVAAMEALPAVPDNQ